MCQLAVGIHEVAQPHHLNFPIFRSLIFGHKASPQILMRRCMQIKENATPVPEICIDIDLEWRNHEGGLTDRVVLNWFNAISPGVMTRSFSFSLYPSRV